MTSRLYAYLDSIDPVDPTQAAWLIPVAIIVVCALFLGLIWYWEVQARRADREAADAAYERELAFNRAAQQISVQARSAHLRMVSKRERVS